MTNYHVVAVAKKLQVALRIADHPGVEGYRQRCLSSATKLRPYLRWSCIMFSVFFVRAEAEIFRAVYAIDDRGFCLQESFMPVVVRSPKNYDVCIIGSVAARGRGG